MKVCAVCKVDLSKRFPGAKYCLGCYEKAGHVGGAAEAWRAVRSAIRAGNLPRASTQACVDCGLQARDYDHRDYSMPLAVEPVCRSCNLRRGPGLRDGKAARPAEIWAAKATQPVTNESEA